jgi:Tol biopolymer transport system component
MKNNFTIKVTAVVAFVILLSLYFSRSSNYQLGLFSELYKGINNISQADTASIGNCDNEKYLGRVVFLVNHDLYLMSGEGCNTQILMENVSDSPAWSPDGEFVAVGCQNDSKLCLIEIDEEIHKSSTSRVRPTPHDVFELPKNCSSNNIRSISWSPNGNFIAVVCIANRRSSEIYILNLQQNSYEQILIDNEILRAIWSPVAETILVSTLKGDIYTIDLQGKNPKFLIAGWAPEWSPEGREIAFIKPNNDKTNPKMGLAVLKLNNQTVEWLYLADANLKQSNLILSCGDLRFDCRLTWSPDSQFIAIGGRSGFMFNWDIFRLEISSGEIINLTENLDSTKNYEPDWGP